MAAPQIPNLLSSRNANPGRGRGRGRGRGGEYSTISEETNEEQKIKKDKIVQQTDQDASVSRMSAVEVGYLDDPFAKEFITGEGQRRFPIINRGTYVRTKAIDQLVDKFLSSTTSKKQIISLGAGSDTRYFRLMDRKPRPFLVYHELDFPTNTRLKIQAIQRSPDLRRCLVNPVTCTPFMISQNLESLWATSYYILPVDLRTLSPAPEGTSSSPKLGNIDVSLPTLFLSECCLIYLDPLAADNVVNYFTKYLFPQSTPLALILYEPINPFDAFGKVMVSNLAARGIVLQTLHKYSSLEAQRERLKIYGFLEESEAWDVDTLFEECISEAEKERVGKVEMLDEVEEWRLLAKHYCIAWGWRDGEKSSGPLF